VAIGEFTSLAHVPLRRLSIESRSVLDARAWVVVVEQRCAGATRVDSVAASGRGASGLNRSTGAFPGARFDFGYIPHRGELRARFDSAAPPRKDG